MPFTHFTPYTPKHIQICIFAPTNLGVLAKKPVHK